MPNGFLQLNIFCLTICQCIFINSLCVLFCMQVLKSRPSLKLCRGMQPKLSTLSESRATNLGGARSDLSSSDSGSEAWFSFSSHIDPRIFNFFDGRWLVSFLFCFGKKKRRSWWVWYERRDWVSVTTLHSANSAISYRCPRSCLPKMVFV